MVVKHGFGIYPDGLTMDTEGKLWVTSIVSNSIVRVDPILGKSELMLQDVEAQHLQWVEEAYINNQMGRPHLDNVYSKSLKNISSLAFGGKNLSTLNLGCLLGNKIATHTSTYKGVPPSHWLFDD